MEGAVVLEGWQALAAVAELRGGWMQALGRLHARHGPLVILRLPSRRRRHAQVLLIADNAIARSVLRAPDDFPVAGVYPALGPRGGANRRLREGIVGARGADHKRQRAQVAPALTPRALAGLLPRMRQIAEEEVAAWPRGETVDLMPLAKRMMRRMALELLFGERDVEQGVRVAAQLERHAELALALSAMALPFDAPGLAYRRLMRQAERAERVLTDWIGRRRRAGLGQDVMGRVLAQSDDNGVPLSDQALAAQLWTLYGASFHTISASLGWLLVLLAQHPLEAQRLLEAYRARGPDTPALATDAILESMRLLAPVPFQVRFAGGASELPGAAVRLAPRDRLILSCAVINRRPELFVDAAQFRPARWTSPGASANALLAFSDGERVCPGRGFAFRVLDEALGAIWTRLRIRLDDGARIDHRTAITLSPARVMARLAPQDGAFRTARVTGSALQLASALRGPPQAAAAGRNPRPVSATGAGRPHPAPAGLA